MQFRRVGYIRNNTLCRDLEGQLDGIALDRVFTDTIVRKKQYLAGFASMLEWVRDGDTLIVQQMDRLARNPEDFLNVVYELTRRGIRIECLNEKVIVPAGAESPARNAMLLLLGSFLRTLKEWSGERYREAHQPRSDDDDKGS